MGSQALPIVSAVVGAGEQLYSQPKRAANQSRNAQGEETKRIMRGIDEQNAQTDRQKSMYAVRNRRRQVRDDIVNYGREGTLLTQNTGGAPAASGVPFTASKTRLGT